MSYIVWSNHHTEGWSPSDELKDLAEVYQFITGDQCQPDFKITKTVEVYLTEAGSGSGISLPFAPGLGPTYGSAPSYPPGARGADDVAPLRPPPGHPPRKEESPF